MAKRIYPVYNENNEVVCTECGKKISPNDLNIHVVPVQGGAEISHTDCIERQFPQKERFANPLLPIRRPLKGEFEG